MRQVVLILLAGSALFIGGCSSEQQPVKPATPVATAPAQPSAPLPAITPQAAPKPAAPAATTAAKPPAVTGAAKPSPVPIEPMPAAVAQAKPAAASKLPTVADTIVLAASQGKVPLPHLVHAKLFPCATCHGEAVPGKIGLTKETAHALCRDCHKAKGAGPTTCTGCHQK